MNNMPSFLVAVALATTFSTSSVLADPPEGKGWKANKEQMKYEKEMRKKEREYEREEAKKYREMEREERKNRKEMEKEEREHEREMYEERRERDYDDDDRYERDRDYRGDASTDSMEEEVIRQGRKWWEVWKSSE